MHLLLSRKLKAKANQVTLSNNATRILVSIVGIPIIISAAYFGKIYFFIFTLAISLISFTEFSNMANKKDMKPNLTAGLTFILLILVNQYLVLIDFFRFFVIMMIILLVIELFRNNGSAIMNLGATLLGIMYIGLFGSTLLSIREMYPDIDNLYDR